jgi:NADH dehydrogenase/NADH:ubiquinone oxidoreductase subunit G
MNAKEALVQIKNLLFTEAEKKAAFALVEGKLVDGTMVAYDLEAGDIFVIGEDGVQIPAPVGEHQLESGEIVIVTEAGKIAEVKSGEPKLEIEIEAAEVPAEEEPKKDEAMAKFEEVLGGLEKKVEELTAKVKAMEEKAEDVKEAVKMSAVVLESLAKEPSDKAITAPNQFAKQLKTEKNDRYNNLQKAFSTLKK